MKWHINVSVEKAEGWQVWEVEADTQEEAFAKFQKGDGDVVEEEIEVISLETDSLAAKDMTPANSGN